MADIDKGLPNIKRPEDEVVEENFEEAKLKHPEAWEDIAGDMDYAINPTEQLWKAEGGIMSLKKK